MGSLRAPCRRPGSSTSASTTCEAWLVSAGVALAEVQDLFGHASVSMTEHYAHLHPENVRSAVVRLDAAQSGFESHRGRIGGDKGQRHRLNPLISLEVIGGSCRIRTYDRWIKSPLLYQLS